MHFYVKVDSIRWCRNSWQLFIVAVMGGINVTSPSEDRQNITQGYHDVISSAIISKLSTSVSNVSLTKNSEIYLGYGLFTVLS